MFEAACIARTQMQQPRPHPACQTKPDSKTPSGSVAQRVGLSAVLGALSNAPDSLAHLQSKTGKPYTALLSQHGMSLVTRGIVHRTGYAVLSAEIYGGIARDGKNGVAICLASGVESVLTYGPWAASKFAQEGTGSGAFKMGFGQYVNNLNGLKSFAVGNFLASVPAYWIAQRVESATRTQWGPQASGIAWVGTYWTLSSACLAVSRGHWAGGRGWGLAATALRDVVYALIMYLQYRAQASASLS